MINTSQGQKTPEEALALFKKAKLPAGDLLGIFKQLSGHAEAVEAREHVIKNPSLYSEKIQRLATEQTTGRPIGAKAINDIGTLCGVLEGCGLNARVVITVRKEKARSLRQLMNLGCLSIDDQFKSGLIAVGMSGEWQCVPREFSASLCMPDDIAYGATRDAMNGVVEKIEILSTMGERMKAWLDPQPLSEEVKAMLAADPDLFYDRNLFLEVCEERAFTNQKKRMGELTDNSSMEDVLMLFYSNGSREEFLEYYKERFMAALS